MSLEIVCREVKNWFEKDKEFNTFKIVDGVLLIPSNLKQPQDGQFIRIVGSVFNDGIYTFPTSGLKDEEFFGAVWYLAIPKEFKDLVDEIDDWLEKNADVVNSPFNSESFGGYSYTKAVRNNGSSSGNGASWQNMFADRLNRWRKI